MASPFPVRCVLAALLAASLLASSAVAETTFRGRVVDADGEPVAEATVRINYHKADWTTDAAAIGTDADGRFEATIDAPATYFRGWRITADAGDRRGFFRFDRATASDAAELDEPIEIVVSPTREAVVRVVDESGEPIADARVGMSMGYPHVAENVPTDADGSATIRIPEGERIGTVVAMKDGRGLDFRDYSPRRGQRADLDTPVPEFPDGGETLTLSGADTVRIRLIDNDGNPVPDAKARLWLLTDARAQRELNLSSFQTMSAVTADADGYAAIEWLPTWNTRDLTFWCDAVGFVHTRGSVTRERVAAGETADIEMLRLEAIKGSVLGPDGQPFAGAAVRATGSGYGMDDARETATTAEDGTFEILTAPKQIYLLTAAADGLVSDTIPTFALMPGEPVAGQTLRLRNPTRLHGVVTEKGTDTPVADQRVSLNQRGDRLKDMDGVELKEPETGFVRLVQPVRFDSTTTDADGRYEFLLGDGDYSISAGDGHARFPIDGEEEIERNLQMTVLRESELKGTVRVEGSGDATLKGLIVKGDPEGYRARDWTAETDAEGRFRVMRTEVPTAVSVFSVDRSLGGFTLTTGDEKTVEVVIRPTGSATGTLVDPATGDPVAGEDLRFGVRVDNSDGHGFSYQFGGTATTDQQGRFTLEPIVLGADYQVTAMTGRSSFRRIADVRIEPDADERTVELGPLDKPEPQKPYVPPTLEERIAREYAVDGTPLERLERALEKAAKSDRRLLIILGMPDEPRIKQFMKVKLEGEDYRAVRDHFLTLAIAPEDEISREAIVVMLEQLGVELQAETLAFGLVAVGPDGSLLGHKSGDDLIADGSLDADALIAWLKTHTPEPVDARELLDAALAQAKRENKRVIIQETAVWCGPCHRLSDFLDAHRVWESDYVWVKMDHRFENAREIMTAYRGDSRGGVPWWAILDADGELLISSNATESGENIGYPSSEEGQTHLRQMLMQTRVRLTDEQIDGLIAALAEESK